MEEIWGPTQAQLGYEGRRDLGNTQPGDGKRFKGRGPIQVTGRANYRKYGAKLSLNLEANPELAATPEVGFRIAGLYWADRGLNALADLRDFKTITRRINGGLNGFADRQRYYERALLVLGQDNATNLPRRILINDQDITQEATALIRDGKLMVALKPAARVMGLVILDISGGQAVLRDSAGSNHRLPLLIKEGRGYVEFAALPGTVTFDSATSTATLSTSKPDQSAQAVVRARGL
jgi:hypothetical protein